MSQLLHSGRIVSPFIGREAELDLLNDSLRIVSETKKSRFLVFLGQQGIGKSRLLGHWSNQIDYKKYSVLHASARQRDGAYRIFRRLFEARFPQLNSEEASIELIRKQVEDVMQDRRIGEILRFLGSFLDISYSSSPLFNALGGAPGQQAGIARRVVRTFFEQDALRKPTILILDNLQFADDLSLELLKELAEQDINGPLLIVAMARTELLAKNCGLRDVLKNDCVCELDPLSEEQTIELLVKMLRQSDQIPEILKEKALHLSQGNPLFVEMLVGVLLDKQAIHVDNLKRWTIDEEEVSKVELPVSVHDAARFRVALLTPEQKDILEKAAVFGGIFWKGAVLCLYRDEASIEDRARLWLANEGVEKVKSVLSELVKRDYLIPLPDSTLANEIEYGFKRGLEREALYQIIEKKKKKRYHLLAAQWLNARLFIRNEPQLEELAHHYKEGGALVYAANCLIEAGDKARFRFDNQQAISTYERALQLSDDSNINSKMDVLHNIGDVCVRLGRYASAQDYFAEMLRLSWLVDHKSKGGAAHRRIGRLHYVMGAFESALTHFHMATKLFRLVGDERGLAATMDDLGVLHCDQGEYKKAIDYHQHALNKKENLKDQRSIAVSLHHLGVAHEQKGAFKEALGFYLRALELRRGNSDRAGVAETLDSLAMISRTKSDYSRARAFWLEALAAAYEIGDRSKEAKILLRLGESQMQLGQLELAVKRIEEATAIAESIGDHFLNIQVAKTQADLSLALGEIDQAYQFADQATDLVEAIQLKPQRGVALRLLGEIAAASAKEDPKRKKEAIDYFLRAERLFEEIGNSLELARTYALSANFHERIGDWKEAVNYRQKADLIFEGLERELNINHSGA